MKETARDGAGAHHSGGWARADRSRLVSAAPVPIHTLSPGHPLLTGKSGAGISVAVVDSGIHLKHPHVGGVVSASGIDPDGGVAADATDHLGHGTAVLSAIHEKAPGALLHVVKVFDRRLSTTTAGLVSALYQCADRGIRLVNLSLGTENRAAIPLLNDALCRCSERGTLVVSARGDEKQRWFPGSSSRAIGVEVDWGCPRDSMLIEPSPTGARFFASGFARPIPGVAPEYNIKGVSFSVANVTGLLACLLEGRDEIRSSQELNELLLSSWAGTPA